MKCEGCPIAYHVYGFQDNRVGNPKVHKWYPNDVCRRKREDCRVAPAQFQIIKAMMAGLWSCNTCLTSGDCEEVGVRGYACSGWQERKEGEDG